MVDEVRPELPDLERAIFFWDAEWDELVAGAGGVADRRASTPAAPGCAPDDADQHPVHVGHDRLPEGRHAQPPQHPQQRLLRGRAAGVHARGPAVHPGALLPLLRHGDGQPRLRHPRRDDGDPRRRLRPDRTCSRRSQDERCTALYGVPTMFIAELAHPDFDRFDLTSLRTGVMAGSPCPVEVMKACVDRMHMTEVTICYGMTETSPVSTQTLPDDSLHHRTATVGRVHPHVEVRIADPDDRRHAASGRDRRVLHPRLLGDAAATGTTRSAPPRPSTPTAGCTPATWP